MILLDAAAVAARTPYDRLVPALRRGLAGRWRAPPRARHPLGGGADMLLMPAWDEDWQGLKLVNVFPGNAAHGATPISSTYLLSDGRTGVPCALIDGHALTTRRTAAVAALAATWLAPRDADHLLLVGAGHVARELPAALAAVRPLRRVTVWARDRDRAAALARALSAEGYAAEPCDDLAAAAAAAPIVACATFATEPLVLGRWLRPDAHLSLIGGFRPDMREADGEAIRRSFTVADTREGVLAEAGDLLTPIAQGIIAADHVRTDLVALCRGDAPPPPPGTATLFKSVGHAAQDLAAARLCVDPGSAGEPAA